MCVWFGFPSLFGVPLFLCACRALSRLLVAAVCRVWWFVVFSLSSSPCSSFAWGALWVGARPGVSLAPVRSVSWGAPVVVSSLGPWLVAGSPVPAGCPSRSVPSWSLGGCSVSLVGGGSRWVWVPCSVPRDAVSAFFNCLRLSRSCDVPVSLGVFGRWDPSVWCCGARLVK